MLGFALGGVPFFLLFLFPSLLPGVPEEAGGLFSSFLAVGDFCWRFCALFKVNAFPTDLNLTLSFFTIRSTSLHFSLLNRKS